MRPFLDQTCLTNFTTQINIIIFVFHIQLSMLYTHIPYLYTIKLVLLITLMIITIVYLIPI